MLVIAFLGGSVHRLVPNVLSFSDFVQRRFGTAVQIYISVLMCATTPPPPPPRVFDSGTSHCTSM